MRLSERDEIKVKLFKVAFSLDIIVKQFYHLGNVLEIEEMTKNELALTEFMIEVYGVAFTTAFNQTLEKVIEDEKTSTKDSN
jgi:hypothetical protein